VLRAHSALAAIASYDGKQQPERELWKPQSRASSTSREAWVIGSLCWPALALRSRGRRTSRYPQRKIQVLLIHRFKAKFP
jgi:hypothetical protein